MVILRHIQTFAILRYGLFAFPKTAKKNFSRNVRRFSSMQDISIVWKKTPFQTPHGATATSEKMMVTKKHTLRLRTTATSLALLPTLSSSVRLSVCLMHLLHLVITSTPAASRTARQVIAHHLILLHFGGIWCSESPQLYQRAHGLHCKWKWKLPKVKCWFIHTFISLKSNTIQMGRHQLAFEWLICQVLLLY